MAAGYSWNVHRRRRQAVSVLGPVVLSVLAVLLSQRLLASPRAVAQAGEPQEIRASAFVLVDADGNVRGRLAINAQGNSSLALLDEAGRPRSVVSGNGTLAALDTNGKLRASVFVNNANNSSGAAAFDENGNRRANLLYDPSTGFSGSAAFDANNTERADLYYRADTDASGHLVYDARKQLRVATGTHLDPTGNNDPTYGLHVRDADGNLIAQVP